MFGEDGETLEPTRRRASTIWPTYTEDTLNNLLPSVMNRRNKDYPVETKHEDIFIQDLLKPEEETEANFILQKLIQSVTFLTGCWTNAEQFYEANKAEEIPSDYPPGSVFIGKDKNMHKVRVHEPSVSSYEYVKLSLAKLSELMDIHIEMTFSGASIPGSDSEVSADDNGRKNSGNLNLNTRKNSLDAKLRLELRKAARLVFNVFGIIFHSHSKALRETEGFFDTEINATNQESPWKTFFPNFKQFIYLALFFELLEEDWKNLNVFDMLEEEDVANNTHVKKEKKTSRFGGFRRHAQKTEPEKAVSLVESLVSETSEGRTSSKERNDKKKSKGLLNMKLNLDFQLRVGKRSVFGKHVVGWEEHISEWKWRSQNKKEVRGFWDELGSIKDTDHGSLHRVKLMIVGQGKAGKTASVRSLLGQDFVPGWESTIGVNLTYTKPVTFSRDDTIGKNWDAIENGPSVGYTSDLAFSLAFHRYAKKQKARQRTKSKVSRQASMASSIEQRSSLRRQKRNRMSEVSSVSSFSGASGYSSSASNLSRKSNINSRLKSRLLKKKGNSFESNPGEEGGNGSYASTGTGLRVRLKSTTRSGDGSTLGKLFVKARSLKRSKPKKKDEDKQKKSSLGLLVDNMLSPPKPGGSGASSPVQSRQSAPRNVARNVRRRQRNNSGSKSVIAEEYEGHDDSSGRIQGTDSFHPNMDHISKEIVKRRPEEKSKNFVNISKEEVMRKFDSNIIVELDTRKKADMKPPVSPSMTPSKETGVSEMRSKKNSGNRKESGKETASGYGSERVEPFKPARTIKKSHGRGTHPVGFTIWDFAGQRVFHTLHHMFLTEFGIYINVIDLRKVLSPGEKKTKHRQSRKISKKNNDFSKEAADHLMFWVNSIRLHARNAPIIIVGTFADSLENGQDDLVQIDREMAKLLVDNKTKLSGNEKEFKKTSFERYGINILTNHEENFLFYPIDNLSGRGIAHLRGAIVKESRRQEFARFKMSVKWAKLLDSMLNIRENDRITGSPKGTKEGSKLRSKTLRNFLTMEEVQVLAQRNGVEQKQIEPMLSFFHNLGCIFYFSANEALKRVIVTRPEWLIDKLSRVIRDHRLHSITSSETEGLQNSGLMVEYKELEKDGICTQDLLEYLWENENVDFLIALMKHTFLISDWNFTSKKGLLRDDVASGRAFLVPSLLPRHRDNSKTESNSLFNAFQAYKKINAINLQMSRNSRGLSFVEGFGDKISRKISETISIGRRSRRLSRRKTYSIRNSDISSSSASKRHVEETGFHAIFDFGFLPGGIFQRLVCLCVTMSGKEMLKMGIVTAHWAPQLFQDRARLFFGEKGSVLLRRIGSGELYATIEESTFCAEFVNMLERMVSKIRDEVMGDAFKWSVMIYIPGSDKTSPTFMPLEEAVTDRMEPWWVENGEDANDRPQLELDIEDFLLH